jgi:hypothetical protein
MGEGKSSTAPRREKERSWEHARTPRHCVSAAANALACLNKSVYHTAEAKLISRWKQVPQRTRYFWRLGESHAWQSIECTA